MSHNIISLGHNCLPLAHYVNNNLIQSKRHGRQSYPFDLMISTYTSLCMSIDNNFSDFLNIIDISNPVSSKYNNDDNVLFYSHSANTKYNNGLICNVNIGLWFNHESPGNPILFHQEKWTSKNMFMENNYELLNHRYNTRIKNFLNTIEQALKNNTEIIFLLNTYYTPIKLSQIIQNKYPTLKFKILCNLMDDRTKDFIELFENDVCYNKISEIPYNSNYCDEHIIMDGWSKMDKIINTII